MTQRVVSSPSSLPFETVTIPVPAWQQEHVDPAWARSALQGLSRRERQILEMLAAWWTTREIADALFISYRTVTTHVTHIYDKLGVNSRREAVTTLLVASE